MITELPELPRRQRNRWVLILTLTMFTVFAGWAMFLLSVGPDGDGAESTQSGSEKSPALNAPAVSDSPNSAGAIRTPLDTMIDLAQSDLSPASFESVPVDVLRGRVIDVDRAPIAGARVSIERRELPAGFTTHQDPAIAKTRQAVAETVSDARGDFEFDLHRSAAVDLRVDAPGYLPVVLGDRTAGEFVEVTLATGFLVFGRVTRESDGAPIGGAKVHVFRPYAPSSLERETETDADGRYEIRFGFYSGAKLAVVPKSEQRSEWIDLAPGSGGNVEKNFELPDGIVVVGRVTAAKSGAPIVGATVREEFDYPRTAVTDAGGEFRLSGFTTGRLLVEAPGFAETRKRSLPAITHGVMHVDFELTRALSVHGRVIGPDRVPLAGVLATALASDVGNEGWRGDWRHARTDSDGRFRIDDLAPDLPHALMLSKHGHGTRVYDFASPGLDTAELDLGTFDLGWASRLAGVVRDTSGRSIVGASVSLRGTNGDRSRLLAAPISEPITGGCSIDPAWRHTRSDAAGRFSFGDLSAGEYSISAIRFDRPPSLSFGHVVQDGQVIDDIEIVLATGASIGGRVIDARGDSVVSARVVASVEGRGHVAHAVTDARGEFKIQLLDGSSEYQLDALPMNVEDAFADEPLIRTTVGRVAVDSKNVIIVMQRGAWIRGTVGDANGAALLGYDVRALDAGDPGVIAMNPNFDRAVATNAAGEFAIRVATGGVYMLEVRGPPQTAQGNTVLVTVPNIAAGTRGLVLSVQ
jgi:Carboxypeptidase regulatory-like domain